MQPIFAWRKTKATDLPDCLSLHPAKNGSEVVGPERTTDAWRQLFEMKHATRSAVVEMHAGNKVAIVGFGLAAFVKKSFAESELKNPRPGLNSRIIESIAVGKSVVASYQEVRDANTRGDLHQVILDTSWDDRLLNPTQRDEVRVLLGRAYQELYAGYRFSLIMSEMVDALDLWHTEGHRSFQVVDRFEGWRRANPGNTWNADRALIAVNFESMRTDPHSVAAELFQHHLTPQFQFTRGEQELLEVALEGFDDTAASRTLFVSLPAIKRRWENIFERVAGARPELCPLNGDGKRGTQKRQRILAYIRNHPEELRPFDFNQHNLPAR